MLYAFKRKKARSNEELVLEHTVTALNEDLLTSCVFERLSYLPGPIAWKLLAKTFNLESYRVATLESIEFWPSWEDPGPGTWVEPDVFLTFHVGDPQQTIMLCVEAKTGGSQYAKQWERQINALPPNEVEKANEVWFCAIGGLERNGSGSLSNIKNQICEETRQKVKDITGASWYKLAQTVVEFKASGEFTSDSPAVRRLLNDILDALGMWGWRYTDLSPPDLPSISDNDVKQTIQTLRAGI